MVSLKWPERGQGKMMKLVLNLWLREYCASKSYLEMLRDIPTITWPYVKNGYSYIAFHQTDRVEFNVGLLQKFQFAGWISGLEETHEKS